ncbi:MAG: alpha-amylase family glycosyl hydrolase, partial [Thermoanaerobaculia bacterium]
MISTPRSFRFALLPVLLALACAGVPPAASARRPTAPAAVQWNHDWARGAVFYEVFVRSFADSNGDGVGDLPGLTGKLDYLKDLGVDALWLMPVFESPSYHGYDTTDYEKIQPAYGTSEDFDR